MTHNPCSINDHELPPSLALLSVIAGNNTVIVEAWAEEEAHKELLALIASGLTEGGEARLDATTTSSNPGEKAQEIHGKGKVQWFDHRPHSAGDEIMVLLLSLSFADQTPR